MSFKLAFDKNLGLELFVSKHMYYDNSKKIFFSSYNTEHMIGAIGSFLLIFLNTDFEDDEDCKSFVFWFCFENLYYRKYPKIKKANQDSSIHLKLSFFEFNKELDKIIKEYKEEFLYLKYTLLKNLRLPFLLLLPICYLCFFPSHISPFKKRRRDSEISKFSPSICVWKQIRIVLQWSVLLNIKRGTKTRVVIVVIRKDVIIHP